MLNNTWQSKELAGKAMIPIIDVPFIRCWGDSNADKTDALILAAIANCSLDENTYLSSHFFTGSVEIEFRYMQAKNLSDNKFYHLYQQQIARAGAGNRAGKDDVSEYQCHHDLVACLQVLLNTIKLLITKVYSVPVLIKTSLDYLMFCI